MNDNRGGFRGYITSRPVRGTPFPQRVQNLVITNYASRHSLPYKLSFTEYAMPGCYMMLQTLLDEMTIVKGVILFSMFILPPGRVARETLYDCILRHGAQLHAALEDAVVRTVADLPRFEDTIQVERALEFAPLRGRFEKHGTPYPPSDPFVAALRPKSQAPSTRPRGDAANAGFLS